MKRPHFLKEAAFYQIVDSQKGQWKLYNISQLATLRELKLGSADLTGLEETDKLQVGHLSRKTLHNLSSLEDKGLDYCTKLFLALKAIEEEIDSLSDCCQGQKLI